MDKNADRGDDFKPTDDDKELTDEEKKLAEEAGGKEGGDDKSDKSDKSDDKKSDKSDKDDEKAGDKGGDDKGGPMLPKRRYDAKAQELRIANEKLKEAEDRLAEYEADKSKDGGEDGLTESSLNKQLRDLDKKVEAARADGDVDEVVDLMNQQRELNNKFFMSKLNDVKSEATTQAQRETALDRRVTELESAYDVLNPESDDFDEELVKEINDLSEALELKGYDPADALTRATMLMVPEIPANAGGEEEKGGKKKTDVKKNVETSKKQPADLEDVGGDSDSGGIKGDIDVNKLTEKEFDDLPEDTRRRLRGDIL